MQNQPFIAMTAGEAAVAITVIVAVAALVLVVVWQVFAIARSRMEIQAREPGEGGGSPGLGEELGS